MADRLKVSDYPHVTHTKNFFVLEGYNLPSTVLRFDKHPGYNRYTITVKLLAGKWPDMKDFADNHSGAIPQCGGHTLREKEINYDRDVINFIVWGCD